MIKRIFQWLGKSRDGMFKSGIRTPSNKIAFSKLPLQDKILTIGSMIGEFRYDDRFDVDSAEKALLALNRKLNEQIIRTWNNTYSERSVLK